MSFVKTADSDLGEGGVGAAGEWRGGEEEEEGKAVLPSS